MPTTTTLEKLFVQIFERKDRIIEQVQQQADSYTQQLASRLLIDGITPPSWLLSPSSSNPKDLEKEDIISKLLLQPQRDSVPYSSVDYSLYYRPVMAGGNGQLSNEISMGTNDPNKVTNLSNEPITTIECHKNDIRSNLNHIIAQDNNINSPQNETDAMISVARIQRSKSRQKARELRTNVKKAAKSCLSNEIRTNISFSGDLLPKNVGKCNDISGTTSIAAEGKIDKENENPSFVNDQSKNSSFSNKDGLDDILVQQTGSRCSLQQSGNVNNVMKEGKLSEVCLGSYASKKSITVDVLKESSLGDNHQENAKIVAGYGPVNRPVSGPVAMQTVKSGIKLDHVALCKESEGLNSKQSPDCCMVVKPKQLNFDEIDESDLNEICSPLSKKRKLDGLSASSIDHFEQQLSNDNIFSSSPKAAKTHYVNINECNDNLALEDVEPKSRVYIHDYIDITCEVKTSPKEVDNIFEENSSEKSHLNEDHASLSKMQIEEDNLDHKCEESAAGAYIPISKNTKSSFISCLTKELNKDSEDLGSSKSKEHETEIGTNPKLSNMKLNSAKFNIPLNQQKNTEDQPYCISDSQNFRVHIQRDIIPCDFETVENNLDSVKESASILTSEQIHVSQPDKKVHDEMMCDLPNETESLYELQIAEATVTEMNDDTTETANTLEPSEPKSGLNLIKKADVGPEDPTRIDDVAVTYKRNFEISLPEWKSSQNDDISATVDDEIMPVYEGFIIDEEVGNTSTENGVDFDMLEIPSTTVARASILEQICKSASMQQTPLSQFSSTLKHCEVKNVYQFMADGVFEHMYLEEDSRNHLQTSESEITEMDSVFQNQQKFKFDSLSFSSIPFYSSPVGKFRERSASSSGSSEKQLSSNPELICFPIEEDPNSNEESENAYDFNDEIKENISLKTENDIVERKENDEVALEKETKLCSQQANPVSNFMKYRDRCSSNSVNKEFSVPKTRDKIKNNPGIKISRFEENNRASSIVTRASVSNRGNLSEFSKNKSVMKSGITRLSQKEPKRNNIISNITSFVPIVQQKQPAAVFPVKRDIKVKALEAAKRREQEKENERKMKKEALKLERARIGKESTREMELNKIKNQEELKKKEVRKRQREEDEKKLANKQRKVIAEAQKNHKIQSVK